MKKVSSTKQVQANKVSQYNKYYKKTVNTGRQ